MQILPSTWRLFSQDVYGEVVEQTPQKERYVAYKMIEKWLAEGKDARQIALIWNQGHTGTCRAGTNKHGVKYDSCSYARQVLAQLN
jgi:hypothetical protein